VSSKSHKQGILIVDDEKLVRNYLKRLILEREDIEILGEAENGIEAMEKVRKLSPDIMLLDIQMPKLDGFGVLDFIEDPPPTIFVTAYENYAIQAFEVNAIDYILKPVAKDRLFAAIDKAKIYIKRKELWEKERTGILKYVRNQEISKIALNTREEYKLLNVEEILWIEADGDYTSIHTADNTFLYNRNLKNLGSRLPKDLFLRVHRSYIVNLEKVTKMVSLGGGRYELRMKDNKRIPVARRRARELKGKLNT
jgi:DNA-binding LytR/AlgR family response regulator